jgi:hypothetical protein
MDTSCLAMTIGVYPPFCSLVYPNHLVYSCHFGHSIPLDLAVTTASLRTLGIASCWFLCTILVPYEWVWFVGSCFLSSNLRPFYDELVKRVRIHSSLLSCSQSSLNQSDVDWALCLFGVYCSLISIPSITVVCYSEWIKGRWILCLFLSFGSVVLNPCMLVPFIL